MREIQVTDDALEIDSFDNLTEEEIIGLWRSIKSSGLSGNEAWDAIVTGLALDMAFDRRKSLHRVDQ